MLHLYESLFRAGYGEHPEHFLSKDELDDYRASLSYYNSQYLELLAMLNTEQSVLFKKLQDNRSDIIGLERDASLRCGLCVGLKRGSLSSLLLSSMRRAKQCRYFASSLPPGYRHSRLTIVRRGCCQVATRRDSWRSHVHRTRLRSACSSSSYRPAMCGVEGEDPLAFLWGFQKGYSLWKENTPFGWQQRHALHHHSAQRADHYALVRS